MVLSTNVAETSMTIEGITAVVDTGVARSLLFDPAVGMDRLQLVPISQASADQRAGRAGRTRPGVCLRLWAERTQQHRPEDEEPEIRRLDLAGPVLQLRVLWRTRSGGLSVVRGPAGRSAAGRIALETTRRDRCRRKCYERRPGDVPAAGQPPIGPDVAGRPSARPPGGVGAGSGVLANATRSAAAKTPRHCAGRPSPTRIPTSAIAWPRWEDSSPPPRRKRAREGDVDYALVGSIAVRPSTCCT